MTLPAQTLPSTRVAFLILAHDKPLHLARLVEALSSEQTQCFVHLDKKSDASSFSAASKGGAIFINSRVKVYWGGWSQVEATLRLIDTAARDERAFTHFALLSGSDYPISSITHLLNFLGRSQAEHIDRVPFPHAEMNKPWSRLSKRRLEGGERAQGWQARPIRLLNRLLERLPDRNVTKALGGMTPYAGSQWWVLSRPAIVHVQRFVAQGGPALKLFHQAHIPDEMFFQTVVSSLPDAVIDRGLTYTDWSGKKSGPAIITCEHLHALQAAQFELDDGFGDGQAYFVRKFDEADESLYELADAIRAERDG